MSAILDLYEKNFFKLGNVFTKSGPNICYNTKMKRFINNFGFHPRVIGAVWELLCEEEQKRNGCKLIYLLSVFCYIKTNNIESQAKSMFDIHEDTYHDWKDYLLRFISQIKVVRELILLS